MLRRYRSQVEAEQLARRLEEEENEAQRRAAEDAEIAEREREEAQVRAELEKLVAAKTQAEEVRGGARCCECSQLRTLKINMAFHHCDRTG